MREFGSTNPPFAKPSEVYEMKFKVLWIAAILATVSSTVPAQENANPGRDYVNSQLPFHAATVDSTGKLIPWFEAEKGLGFDKVMHLGWDYMEHQVKTDPKTGLKIYLINPTF